MKRPRPPNCLAGCALVAPLRPRRRLPLVRRRVQRAPTAIIVARVNGPTPRDPLQHPLCDLLGVLGVLLGQPTRAFFFCVWACAAAGAFLKYFCTRLSRVATMCPLS
eukprot:5500668-Pyramimonas_sp.AAC.1